MEMNAKNKRKYDKFRRLWATQRATVAQIHFVMAYQRSRDAAAKRASQ